MTHPHDRAPIDTLQNLRLELLRLTDDLIGAQAELSTERARIEEREREMAEERVEYEHSLSALRTAYETSTTWRIGRRILQPVEAVRRGASR